MGGVLVPIGRLGLGLSNSTEWGPKSSEMDSEDFGGPSAIVKWIIFRER